MKNITVSIILVMCVFVVNSQDFLNSNYLSSSNTIDNYESIVDENGNIYVYGRFLTDIQSEGIVSRGSYDLFFAKYNKSLKLEWIKPIQSSGWDEYGGLAINDNQELFITGSFQKDLFFTENDSVINTGALDVFVAKYDTTGNLLLKKNIAYGGSLQKSSSISIDKYGDLIVTGQFIDSVSTEIDTLYSSRSTRQNFLLKLDSDGNAKLVVHYENSNSNTKFESVKAFDDGYYLSGNFEDTIYLSLGDYISKESSVDMFILKTDFNGDPLWLRRSYGSENDLTGTLGKDSYGNIVCGGYFNSDTIEIDSTHLFKSKDVYNNGGSDLIFYKFNKTGNLIWVKNYGSEGGDFVRDIVVDKDYINVTGYISDTVILGNDTLITTSTADKDIFLATLNNDGDFINSAYIKGVVADGEEGGKSIVLYENRIIISGYFNSSILEIGDSTYLNAGSKSFFICTYITPYSATFTNWINPTCNSGADGELIVTPYFGVPPYTYTWSHDAGLNDSTATGLSAGTYFVTVTDALDSTDVVQYTLTEPDAFLFNPAITNVSTCSYSSEGAINLNVTGGNGTNTYYWVESNGGSGTVLTAEDQTGLTVGQYDVTVTDTEGCAADTSILIAGPAPVNFGSSTTTAYTGADPVNTGAINLELGGGTGTPSLYAASWSGPGSYTAATQDISGLNPGNYTVTVTDGNVCTFDTTITVLDDDKLLAYISYKKDDCSGGVADGKATVSYYTPNTTPNISFEWSNGETTQTVTGLGVGKYYVTVTDSNLGQTSEDSVEIVDLGYTISGSLTGNNVLDCKGDTDGNIDLTISSAGVAPYTYNWSNGKTTQDINNLTAGFYSVTITDANECVYTSSNYEISEPEFVLAATASVVSDPLCNGDYNGEIRVDANGGNGAPFTYQWNDPGSQTTQIADGLDAGNYTVTVTDWKGCKATSNVLLTQPQVLAANGLVGDISCYNGLTGTIALTVNGGTTPHSYFWQTNDGSGLVVTDKNQSGLSAAKYYVTVTDANLCEVEDSFLVSQPDQIVIDSEDQLNIENCFGDNTGEITIAASGGTGTLSYTLTPGDVQNTTGIFTGLNANTYSVSVTDDNGCGPVTSSSIEITEPAELQLSVTNTNNISCNGVTDGDIDITVSGGTVSGAYTYLWTSTDGSGLVSDSEDQTGLGAGTYNVTASDDNGCEVTESATITEPDAIIITIESVTDASSQTAADGSATVSATGGTGDIEFTLTPGDVVNKTGVFTNLTPGTYTVNVTDEKSCGPVSEEFSVGYPDGIEYISEHNNVKIYPNPTSSNITVDIDLDNIENLKIEILGASGRIVESRYVFGGESIKEEIDLSKYSKGIYFVKITSNKVNLINKIILQ